MKPPELTEAEMEAALRDDNPLVRTLAQEVRRLRAALERQVSSIVDPRNSDKD